MAKPTPLQVGRADPHIMESRGAEPYIMNFYCTQYSTTYTKPNTEIDKSKFKDIPGYSGHEAFKPRSAPLHTTSGFTSNDRGQIYYRRTLDDYDNPEIGRLLENNYLTITHADYKPYQKTTGFEELPVQVQGQKSAFTQGSVSHNPRPDDVYDLFTDTRIRGAPYDIDPNHKPRLHHVHHKDPLPKENYGYGPKFMSTEYATNYIKKAAQEKLNPAVGPKEPSGFVLNKEIEDTITNTPGERWVFPNRTTGISDYKSKFQPYGYPRSETALPNLVNIDKTRESTYTKAFRPSDINPKGPFGENSEYKDKYMGKQEPDTKLSEKLGTAVIGPKEMSGHSHESGKVQTADDPRRFITNYQIRHYDMNPKGKDREGFVTGGVQNMKEDGFTKSTQLHQSEAINTHANLVRMDPYQSRSIRANNPYYDDHSHDHKFSIKHNVVRFEHNNPYSVNS